MIDYDYSKDTYDTLKNNDTFERYKYIPSLEKIILSQKDNCFVLQVSGQYGSGKTFFINLLNKYLLEQGYQTLYYNAWENDYAQDAFVSFCSMFVNQFDVSPNKNGFKEASKKLFTNNIPLLLKYCCKEIITNCIGINTDKLVDLACDLAKGTDKYSNQTQEKCNDLLDIEFNRIEVVKNFRKELEKLVINESKSKPLIVFIDDLDRCKADFTIRLLDYVKHLFNVKGVTFILAVDDKQLKSTVRKFYGSENENGYLSRIIDYEFKLPVADYKNYINKMISKYKFSEQYKSDIFVNLLNNLGFLFDLSLRDFDHIFNQVHSSLKGDIKYEHRPSMYFMTYIMEKYFYKYENEINLLETEENKKLNNSQKLYRFFNKKFLLNHYYIDSVLTGGNVNTRKNYTVREIMSRLVYVPSENYVPCDNIFPEHINYTDVQDNQKTRYDIILEDMDNIQKEF